MTFYENKDMTINCPKCKSFLAMADSRDINTHRLRCKNCGKWIWFIPAINNFEVKEVPERTQGSGKRFY
ncbi:MAG: hypothetical protein ACI4EU_02965 [Butyrivibrio sp.]